MNQSVNHLMKTQPNVALLLENSLLKGRLAHAYLFEGSRGTGKRAVGIALAQALLCLTENDRLGGCGACLNCQRVAHLQHPDIFFVEPDGLSIKKDQVKSLHEAFQKRSLESGKKIFLIDSADKMTASAANSLLKFLEEPYEGTILVLMTEQVQRILPTIVSRCQRVSFKALDSEAFADMLVENGVSPVHALLLTQLTNDLDEACSIGLGDQFLSLQKVALKLLLTLSRSSMAAMLVVHEEWMPVCKEREQHELGLDLLLLLIRDLLWLQLGAKDRVLNKAFLTELEQLVWGFSKEQIAEGISKVMKAKQKLRSNMNPQLLMEELVLQLGV